MADKNNKEELEAKLQKIKEEEEKASQKIKEEEEKVKFQLEMIEEKADTDERVLAVEIHRVSCRYSHVICRYSNEDQCMWYREIRSPCPWVESAHKHYLQIAKAICELLPDKTLPELLTIVRTIIQPHY